MSMQTSKEFRAIQGRLRAAFVLDKAQYPNTYEIPCNLSHILSRPEQYENEEKSLREIVNLDGSPIKQSPEFE